jgi:hypothetical protein
MKKILIVFTLAAITLTLSGQAPGRNSFGLGIISLSMDARGSSNSGINISLGAGRFYFDLSNNLATGSTYGGLNEGRLTGQERLNLGVVNMGYVFRTGRYALIPLLGWAWSGILDKGFLGQDFWTFKAISNQFNAGMVFMADLTRNLGWYAGFGLHENFKSGIIIRY